MYLIDLKFKESMHQYYGAKQRFEYTLEDRESFIKSLAHSLEAIIHNYDWIAIPESSNSFLKDILLASGVPFFVVQKNSIENVMNFFNTLPLQKKEKLSHLERLQEMGSVFKINLMKANQRVKYESVIFDKVDPSFTTEKGHKGLVIDDSCFSGTTLRGLKSVLPKFDFLAIFSK